MERACLGWFQSCHILPEYTYIPGTHKAFPNAKDWCSCWSLDDVPSDGLQNCFRLGFLVPAASVLFRECCRFYPRAPSSPAVDEKTEAQSWL